MNFLISYRKYRIHIWNFKFNIWSFQFHIWNFQFQIWNFQFHIWNFQCHIWNCAFHIWNCVFHIWNYAFHIWNLLWNFRNFSSSLPSSIVRDFYLFSPFPTAKSHALCHVFPHRYADSNLWLVYKRSLSAGLTKMAADKVFGFKNTPREHMRRCVCFFAYGLR